VIPIRFSSPTTMNQPSSPTILCGTDFSDPARAGADAAAALATRFGMPVRLIHASEIASSPWVQDHLKAEAQRLHDAGTALAAEVVEGVADEVLVRLAQERAARLIVVSSLGQRAPARWLLGSVAERTAEFATVPTLVVRDAAPFQAWARGERALKVFVGTDFSANSEAALRWVAELRKYGPCEVIAAYAAWTPEEASRLGAISELGLVGSSPVVQSVLERDLKEKITRLLGDQSVRVLVQGGWGRPDVQLVGMAVEAQADLMVVGTHQRHGFSRLGEGSVSRGVLRHAPMSVACVPAPMGQRMAVPAVRACPRVLVAVDLNESHGFATPYGYGICSPGGTVRLVHVAGPFPPHRSTAGGFDWGFPSPQEHRDHLVRLRERLQALAPGEGDARGIRTEGEVIEDREVAHAICAAAERFNADVICIGSHTRPGFGAKVLGSVALGVLQRSRRPVLVVWPPSE